MTDDHERLEKYGKTICRMLGYDPDALNSQGVPRWRIFEEIAEEVIKIADEEISNARNASYMDAMYFYV